MTYSQWNAILNHRPIGRPPDAADAGIAMAEVDTAGRVRHINRPGMTAWGWQTGFMVPEEIRDALRQLEKDGAHALPVRPGGLYLLGTRLVDKGGWLLLGYTAEVETVFGSKSDFKTLIEMMPALVLRMKPGGIVLYANAGAAAVTGHTAAELVGRAFWHEAVHPEDHRRLTEAWEEVAATGAAHVRIRFYTRERALRVGRMHLFRVDDAIDGVVFDVTDQHAAEEALFQSETLYRAFLEQSPMGMLHLDAGGGVTFENHPFRQIVGEAVEDAWIGLNLFEIPGLDPGMYPYVRALLERGVPVEGVATTFARRDGLRHLLVHGSPIRNPDGAIVGGVLLIDDVTEAKQREAALGLRDCYRMGEADLRKAAVEDPDEATFLQATAQIFGQTTGVDRVHLLVYTPLDDVVESRAVWVRGEGRTQPLRVCLTDLPALRGLAAPGLQRLVHAHPDAADTRSLLALTGASGAFWLPFYDDGRLGGVVVLECIGPDAPLRTPDEVNLMRHLVGVFETLWAWLRVGNRYRHIVSVIDDGLFHFAFDEDGARRYLFATPQFEALCGYPPAGVMGGALQWIDDVVHPADRERVRTHDRSLREGHDSRILYRVQHADGTLHWLREHGTPREDAPGRFTVSGILTDVTEQKTAEEVLRQAKQEAEASNQLKTAFIATMSHEIRTPLGAVNGFADLLLNEIEEFDTPLPPQFQEFAEAIRDRARKLLTLVNDLFDLSNIDGGILSVQRVPVAVHEVIRDVSGEAAAVLAGKGVALHLELDPADPVVVGDPRRIRQVLGNLMANAVKFTDVGSVTVRTALQGGEVLVEVRDTGVGIDAAYLDRLFTPFSQEEDWRSRRFEGTGLGLTMVRRLLDLLGGRIEVESRKQEGSTFRVYLPAVRHTPSHERRKGAQARR